MTDVPVRRELRMNDPRTTKPSPRRRTGALSGLVPVVWIAVLLAFWFLAVEWKMLPDLFSATIQVLS